MLQCQSFHNGKVIINMPLQFAYLNADIKKLWDGANKGEGFPKSEYNADVLFFYSDESEHPFFFHADIKGRDGLIIRGSDKPHRWVAKEAKTKAASIPFALDPGNPCCAYSQYAVSPNVVENMHQRMNYFFENKLHYNNNNIKIETIFFYSQKNRPLLCRIHCESSAGELLWVKDFVVDGSNLTGTNSVHQRFIFFNDKQYFMQVLNGMLA